jgi:hypothetical protein
VPRQLLHLLLERGGEHEALAVGADVVAY